VAVKGAQNRATVTRRARRLLRRLLGSSKYKSYLRTGRIIIRHGGRIFELHRGRTEAFVFDTWRDYLTFRTRLRKKGRSYTTWWLADVGVRFERWCVMPNYELLRTRWNMSYTPFQSVSPDEEVLAKYVLLKYQPKLFRQMAHVMVVEPDEYDGWERGVESYRFFSLR
jgi:hypothetical protein